MVCSVAGITSDANVLTNELRVIGELQLTTCELINFNLIECDQFKKKNDEFQLNDSS